jgi:hypothetical protein
VAQNLNEKLDLEENVTFYQPEMNYVHLRIFVTALCVGCLFGKLFSNNKLRFPNVYLQFIALLQPAVLSAILHVETS